MLWLYFVSGDIAITGTSPPAQSNLLSNLAFCKVSPIRIISIGGL